MSVQLSTPPATATGPKPPTIATRSKRYWSSLSVTGKFFLAIAPALLIYGIFTVYPMLQVVLASFTDSHGFNTPTHFIGLQNYIRLFSADPSFINALENTGIYAFFKIVVQTILAFGIALLLNRKLRLGYLYRACFFAPMVISPVAIVFTWSFMFDPTNGTINHLLQSIGLGALQQDWLGNYSLALYSVIVVDLWAGLGFNIVIFLAGLSTIPSDIVEAARMDGARGWRVLRHITIPMMSSAIGLVLVLAINGALQSFNTVYLMTRGGPGEQTQLFMTKVFNEAMVKNQFGYASAMAMLVVVLLVCIAVAQNKITKKVESERI